MLSFRKSRSHERHWHFGAVRQQHLVVQLVRTDPSVQPDSGQRGSIPRPPRTRRHPLRRCCCRRRFQGKFETRRRSSEHQYFFAPQPPDSGKRHGPRKLESYLQQKQLDVQQHQLNAGSKCDAKIKNIFFFCKKAFFVKRS